MTSLVHSSQLDEILQETAARLITILGLDSAIHVCRSNDWVRVLRFVLAYKKAVSLTPRS